MLIGYPLAHWMRGLGGRGRMIAIALVVLPFWVSILVRTYAWIGVLGNGGLVNRFLQWTGLTDAPVSFLYNELGVTIGLAALSWRVFERPLLRLGHRFKY